MASGSKKVIYAALIGNGLIAISKFVGSAITGSAAMLSEAIHSVVDTGNQILLLLGLRRAKKPADKNYPFGHGKEIYFWSFVVAISIFAVGAGISIYEGIHSLMDPHPVTSPYINYIILSLAICFELGAWYFAWKEFKNIKGEKGFFEEVRTSKDPTTFVVLFEDSAALAGLVVAMVGIWLGQVTGNPIWDGIASIAIGVILALTACWLAYETKGLLIGESTEPDIVLGISEIANRHKQVVRVNETLTLHMGPQYILVTISADFSDNVDAAFVEDEIAQLSKEIKDKFPRVKRVFIEAEEPKNNA